MSPAPCDTPGFEFGEMAFTAAAMAGVKSGRSKRKLLGVESIQSNDGFWKTVVSQALRAPKA
jgi:hypothetical protein